MFVLLGFVGWVKWAKQLLRKKFVKEFLITMKLPTFLLMLEKKVKIKV